MKPLIFSLVFLCHRLTDICFLNIGPMILLSAKFLTYIRYEFSDIQLVDWKWQILDRDEESYAISTAGKHRKVAAMLPQYALCLWLPVQQPLVPCKPQCQRISFFNIQVKIYTGISFMVNVGFIVTVLRIPSLFSLIPAAIHSFHWFSGDHDMLVPFLATQAWIRSLNYSVVDDWRPWFVHAQIAGYVHSWLKFIYQFPFQFHLCLRLTV